MNMNDEQLAETFQSSFAELQGRYQKMIESYATNIFRKDAPHLLGAVNAVVKDVFTELRNCTSHCFIAGQMVAPWLLGKTCKIARNHIRA